ncbi:MULTISPECIES: hypothetical protein [Chromobacterium]|uniref:Uncharacterized protein n=1 Tax=Chromobacterium aquaticum TaxID=467180 RepID=A0ABV8ZVW4_9NEIS|nr:MULTISPECIES: hypothetical protein [Chromobacterium]KMN33110.1 hypothetical protein VI26_16145 [Chromobacterium sp. LK1]MCD5363633.1 hypothetical protein [Chromobacterium aquaticum]
MTATPTGWFLLALIALFYLHILWRLIASRDGIAQACFAASFFILALAFRKDVFLTALSPVLLPFCYAYAWLGIAAVLWSASSLRVSRLGLAFPERQPQLAALMASQLSLHLGIVAFSRVLDWRPLLSYLMAPPLIVVVSYLGYRTLLYVMRHQPEARLPWPVFAGMTLISPLLVMWLADWLAPIVLGMT